MSEGFKNSFKNALKKDKIKQITISMVIGFSIFTIGLIIISFLMYFLKQQSNFLYYLSYLFLFVGAYFSAGYLYKKVKGRGFIIGLIAATIYFVSITLFGWLLLGSQPGGIHLLLSGIISLSGGLLGGIMSANK